MARVLDWVAMARGNWESVGRRGYFAARTGRQIASGDAAEHLAAGSLSGLGTGASLGQFSLLNGAPLVGIPHTADVIRDACWNPK